MKNSSLPVMIFSFIVGVVVGGALLAWFGPSKGYHMKEVPGVYKISLDSANQHISWYRNKMPLVINDTFRYYKINRQQIYAISLLLEQNKNLEGVWFYSAVIGDPVATTIVTSGDGKMYETSGSGSGPCPTICDTKPPIK
jgi:hypothetical protein